jgi:hypothetical protein
MAFPDPKAALSKIADELKEKADEAGLGNADAFVDKLEDIKETAKKGPGEVMDKVKSVFEDFKKTLDKAIEDPSSIAGGGAAAACAAYVGNAIVSKLKAIAEEAATIFESIKELGGSLKDAFKSLAETMGKAMEGIMGTVKGLSGLPGEVQKLGETCKGADDVGKIDTAPMKGKLDTSKLGGPLGDLEGLKSSLGPLIETVKSGMEKLAEFIMGLGDKLREAFQVPFPICCIGAPPMLADMLKKVDLLKEIKLDSITDALGNVSETVGNLDVSKVKTPVEAFAASAKEKVEDLDKVVSGAKMAGGLPGGMPGF